MAGGFGQNTDIDNASEPLTSSTIVQYGVWLKAGPGNSTNIVYVGTGTVTTANGFPIALNDPPLFIPVGMIPDRDLANLSVIGSTTNLVLAFMWV